MSLYDNNSGSNMVMPVGPMGGFGGGYADGFGGGLFWIIVLFLFAIMGNGNGFGWGNGGGVPMMMNNTNNDIQRGFDQQAVMGGINGVASSINSLAQGQCAGFANMATAMNSGFANAETAANARQMADMQQAFANQTAMTSGMNSLAMGLQNCCCENRAATADLKEYGPYEDHEESGRGRMNYRWGDQDNRESHWSYPTKANWHTQPNYNNRSSYSNSYSSGPDNTIANLRNLMNNANSESERMMYQRFIDEAEHMR